NQKEDHGFMVAELLGSSKAVTKPANALRQRLKRFQQIECVLRVGNTHRCRILKTQIICGPCLPLLNLPPQMSGLLHSSGYILTSLLEEAAHLLKLTEIVGSMSHLGLIQGLRVKHFTMVGFAARRLKDSSSRVHDCLTFRCKERCHIPLHSENCIRLDLI